MSGTRGVGRRRRVGVAGRAARLAATQRQHRTDLHRGGVARRRGHRQRGQRDHRRRRRGHPVQLLPGGRRPGSAAGGQITVTFDSA